MSDASFFDLAMDVDFWRNMNPELTITPAGSMCKKKPLNLMPSELKAIRETLIEDGYFQLDSVLNMKEVRKLAEATRVIRSQQWPTVFGFVYDEFWQLHHPMSQLLDSMLGHDYLQMPNIWVFHVDPTDASKGWVPHRDRSKVYTLREDGTSYSLNLWIPLTEATPLNGCMYILPAGRDPNYPLNPYDQNVDSLQDVRALPARAGGVLGWNETVFHWGARSSRRAETARMAVATVFQSSEIGALETPLKDPLELPDFQTRLWLIGQQFQRFTVQEMFNPAEAELATQLSNLRDDNVTILDDGNQYWDIVEGQPIRTAGGGYFNNSRSAILQAPPPEYDADWGVLIGSAAERLGSRSAGDENGNGRDGGWLKKVVSKSRVKS